MRMRKTKCGGGAQMARQHHAAARARVGIVLVKKALGAFFACERRDVELADVLLCHVAACHMRRHGHRALGVGGGGGGGIHGARALAIHDAGVSDSVERVFCVLAARRHRCNDNGRVGVFEAGAQQVRQLAFAVGQEASRSARPAGSLAAHAFLERRERAIDLRALLAAGGVVLGGIDAMLAARQVDELQAALAAVSMVDEDAAHRVAAR
jgi:hypothetical protein